MKLFKKHNTLNFVSQSGKPVIVNKKDYNYAMKQVSSGYYTRTKIEILDSGIMITFSRTNETAVRVLKNLYVKKK